MTSYGWAALSPIRDGVPGATILISPWQLTARLDRPRQLGFTRLRRSPDLNAVGTVTALRVEPDPAQIGAGLVVADASALNQRGISHWQHGDHFLRSQLADDGGLADFWEAARNRHRILLATADLATVHRAGRPVDLRTALSRSWAAWIPLRSNPAALTN